MRVYGKYSTRVRVERLIQHEAKPSAVFASRHPLSAVFFVHTSIGGALSVILYFLAIVWLRAIFSSTQTTAVIRISVSVYIIYFESYNELIGLVRLVLAIYNVTYVLS